MSTEAFEFRPIGIVHSPYRTKEETPIQSRYSDARGEIEIFEEYADGLKDLEGFSHIWVLYVFHKSEGHSLHVKPYLDDELRGVFACRAPRRPNPIGMSLVELLERRNNMLLIKGLDMLDGTPVLDIKPYINEFDEMENIRTGWIKGRASSGAGQKGG